MVITKSGYFRTTNFDLSNHFEDDVKIIEKYREGKIWSAAYFDAEQKYYYLKRFLIEAGAKRTRFIGEHPESRLIRITEVEYPRLELKFGGKNKNRNPEIIEVAEFIGIKSYKARGKRLSNYEVKVIQELSPEKEREPENEKKAAPKKETAKKEPAKKERTKTKTTKKTPPQKQKTPKQDPDDVPMEVIKPKEEKESSKKNDSEDDDKQDAGQFTLEW